MIFGKKKEEKIKTEGTSSYDDNVFDLSEDDFDLGFDFDDAQRHGRVRRFGKGMLSGFDSEESKSAILSGLISGALPESYSNIFVAGKNTWKAIKDNVSIAKNRNAEELHYFNQRIEENLPRLEGKIRKKYYDRLDNAVKASSERLTDTINLNKSYASLGKENVSQEEMDNSTVSNTLRGLFRRSEKRTEERDINREAREESREHLRIILGDERFKTSLTTLKGIEYLAGRQVSYQDRITSRFQRKQIELGYRQFFALRDIRRLTAAGLENARMVGEVLIHNTSLPDFFKQRHAIGMVDNESILAEIGRSGEIETGRSPVRQLRQSMMENASAKFQESIPQFLAEFYPSIQKNVQRNVSELLSGAQTLTSMGGAFDIRDLNSETVGRESGNWLGQALGAYIMPRLGTKFEPLFDGLTTRLKGRNYLASYAIDNASSILQDFATNFNQDDGTFKGILRRLVRANIPEYSLQNKLEEGSFNALEQPVPFNHLSQRALVEIIPGYLSRLLQEMRMTRTGDDTIEREVYDITKGRWVTVTTSRKNLRSRIVTDTERDSIKTTLDDLVSKYDADSELGDDATKVLRNQLMADAARNRRFDPERYIRDGFGDDVDQQTNEELINFFRRQFDVDVDGKLVADEENYKRLNDFGREFRRLMEVMPNSKQSIERIHKTGSQELLREMGIVYSSHGNDYINFDNLWKLYRGEDDDAVTPSDGPSPKGPSSPTPSGPGMPSPGFSEPTQDAPLGPTPARPSSPHRHSLSSYTPPTVTLTGQEEYTPVDTMVLTPHPDKSGFRFQQRDDVDPVTRNVNTSNKDDVPYPDKEEKEKPISIKRLFEEQRQNFTRLFDRVTDTGTIQVDSEGNATPVRKTPISAFRDILKNQWSKTPGFKDLYNHLGKKILLKRDVENKRYIDVNTGKVIEGIDDITGPVVDEDDNLVITAEDFERGLFDIHGHHKAGERANALLSSESDALGKHQGDKKSIFQRLGRGGAFLKKRYIDPRVDSWKRGTNRDAYLPGEEEPRITVQGIKDGKYFNNKGKVIKHFDDIGRSTVFDEFMNVVVGDDELPNMVDVFGNPHRIATTYKTPIRSTIRNAARRYMNWTMDYYKKLPGRTLGFAKGVGRAVKNTAGFFFGKPLNKEEASELTGRVVERAANGLKTYRGYQEEFYNRNRRAREWTNFDDRRQNTSAWANHFVPDIARGPAQEDMPQYTGERPDKTPEEIDQDWASTVRNKREYRWVKDPDREVPEETLTGPQDALLNRINESINDLKPKEHREGSWQQWMEDKKNQPAKEKEEEEKQQEFVSIGDQLKNVFGPLTSILGGLGNLLGIGGGAAAGAAGGGLLGRLGDLARGGSGANPVARNRPGFWRRTWNGIRGARGAGATGTALRSGGGLLARGLMLGATTPVGWAVTAGLVTAYAGYKLWNRHQETAGKLYRIRMAQYGIDPTNRDQAIPILELEEAIEQTTRRDEEGNVDVRLSNINPQYLLDLFKIDDTDEEHISSFTTWFSNRFIAVWKHHQAQLGLLREDAKLTNVDEEIDKEKAIEFIDMVARLPASIYNVTSNPYTPAEPLPVTEADVDGYIEEARAHYQRDARRREERRTTRQTGILAGMGPVSDPANERRTNSDNEADARQGPRGSGGVATPDDTHARSNVAQQVRKRALTFLQKFRGYAYGLSHFDDEYIHAFLTLEDDVFKNISIDSNGQAEFSGRTDHFLSQHSQSLGIAWGVQRREMRQWREWFEDRFLNVLLTYVAKLRQLEPSERPATSGSHLSKEKQLAIANAIVGAKKQGWIFDKTIWDITPLELTGHDPSLSLELSRELILDFEAQQRQPTRPTRRVNPMPHPSTIETTTGTQQKEEEERAKPTPGDMGSLYRQTVHNLTNQETEAFSLMNPNQGGGNGSGPVVTSRGAVYGDLGSGSGGAWEQVPYPSANGSRSAAMETLNAVEQMTGVDADLLATKAFVESSFNYNAGAGTSSAKGWFQFIDSTWDAVVERYGSQYGITNDPNRRLRMDPRANALMAAELLKENYRALERSTGKKPTDTELYLAHFLGAGNASKVLTADNPNTIAAYTLPKQAEANPTVFYSNGRPRTYAELIQWADEKMAPGRQEGAEISYVDNHYTPDVMVNSTPPVAPQSDTPAVTTMEPSSTPTSVDVDDDVYGPRNRASLPTAPDTSSEPVISDEHNRDADRRFELYSEIERSSDPYGPRTTTYRNTPNEEQDVREVEQQRQRVITERREQERRQRETLEQSSNDTVAIGGIAQRQLETQQEMSGYLKRIAEHLDVFSKGSETNGVTPSNPQQPSNDTSVVREPNRPSSTIGFSSQREPSAVSMNR